MSNPSHESVSYSVKSEAPGDSDAVAEAQEVIWVQAAQGGDLTAFSRLVRIYERQAVAVAYRFLGNAADAADVVQEAFLRAFRKLDQLDDGARFRSWLMRIVTNLSLNFRRGRKRSEAAQLEDAFEPEAPGDWKAPGGGGWADRSASSDELKTRIDEAIRSLPENQRAALILFSIEGLPQKDVAEILGCSVELVKWNVFQARKKLKELLADMIG
ncbi:MAG: sigma-70 family RNA polymerase sigma factor [Planctomycetota bacterium]|nr:MAG: sigma-70 family RNA polymerase sigma factor [Planctomycetota bacterium]KAB2947670.1 MAG: sigma-70 family RNA polymerase sigma factor [Phycisphaerae bacterium]MCQ3920075.1 RNA polymerase subunit sigma-24 [Planctomycetota bacterium]